MHAREKSTIACCNYNILLQIRTKTIQPTITWVLSLLSYTDDLFCFWVTIFTLWYTVSSFYYLFTHTLLKGPTLILISLKTLYNTWLGDWNSRGILESGSISFSALSRKVNTTLHWSGLKDFLKWSAVIGNKSSKNIKKKKKSKWAVFPGWEIIHLIAMWLQPKMKVTKCSFGYFLLHKASIPRLFFFFLSLKKR